MTRRVRGIGTVLAAVLFSLLPTPLSATWSIIAVDARTGLVVIASATCVTAEGLRTRGGLKSIQAVIVPGVGVAAAQAGVDRTRANQTLIYEQMRAGTDPDEILRMLSEDESFQRRQFGIVDLQGRMAGFSGMGNGYASLDVQGNVRDEGIYFAVQGNILESDMVVLDAVEAILADEGTVVDRVMAGMIAADVAGGDSRCSCRTDPVPETDGGCEHRTAHVAYIAAARPDDAPGQGHSDGDYTLFIDVDDENTGGDESPNPVETLRRRYEAWKAGGGPVTLGLDTAPDRQLAAVDRSGRILRTIGPAMESILDPSISPDGSTVAVRGRMVQGERDRLYVLEGSSAERLTDNEGFERHMIYSPDGSRIAYSIQDPGGVSNLFVRAADGSGGDRPLVVSEGMHKWYPSWTPDASSVVFHTNDPETEARDLWYVDVASGETGVLVDDDGIQALARLSRDGRFVAYQSNQDGTTEIYVTTFPPSDARWKVSTDGGTWPKWSDDELYYWEGNALMAVEFDTAGGFRHDAPQRLFTGAGAGMGADNQMSSYNPEYDVAADGSWFVVTRRLGG